MAGPRQPTEVVEARGAKHFSTAELAARKAQDLRPKKQLKRLAPPSWLPENLQKEFRALAKQIIDLMPTLVCKSDADTLASWCMVHAQWLQATDRLNGCLRQDTANVADASKWAGVQSKLFAQSRALARDLGLTISSRCELVIPSSNQADSEDNNPMLKLILGGMTRDA